MIHLNGTCDVVRYTPGRSRSPFPRARACAGLMFLAAMTSAAPVGATQSQGRWLPNSLPDNAYNLHYASFDGLQVATHMAVLRGSADSTVILYWHSPDETFVMTHLDQGYPAMPVFNSNNRKNVKPPAGLNTDIFCAGNSSLPNGRLLVTGGTGRGQIGISSALIFDPLAYNSIGGNNGWSAAPNMTHERWYPSQVTLANGTISYSGVRYWEMMTHGGLLSSGSTSDSLILFGLTAAPFWRERYPHRGDPATGIGPTARTDHTGGWFGPLRAYDTDQQGVISVYGGRTGAAASSAVNEMWIAWRAPFDPEESWSWKLAGNVTAGATPPKRYQHSAVVHETWNKQYTDHEPPTDSLALFVYGGLDETGAASDELWLFRAFAGTSSFGFTTWKVNLSGAGTGPGPRYGHTAIFDPGPSVPANPTPRMLVYGGRQADGTLADGDDNKVWALTLTPPYQWSEVATHVGAPPARYRHTATFRGVGASEYDTENRLARMIVFGGEGSGGTRSDTWVLSRCNNASTCATQFTWTEWSSLTQPPTGRYRHSAMYDVTNERMIVFGGDLNSGTPSLTDQTFALPVAGSIIPAPSGVAWQALNPPYASGGPRAGHIAVYHGWEITSRLPERYDPGTQTWTPLSTALRFDRQTYPNLFRLPSGNVFYAGRNNRTLLPNDGFNNSMNGTAVLNLSGTPSWNEDVASPMGGAAAIMYRQGKILKAGYAAQSTPQRDHTAWADLTTNESSYTWQHDGSKGPDVRLLPRINENLTMLPTGDVLATGGYSKDFDPGTAKQAAQIWDPGTQEWTLALASDPSKRSYHSVAILLPSAVILSAGGHGQADKYDYASIYQPPYLFKAGNVLRDSTDRPRIWGSLPPTVAPGQVFTVCMPPGQSVARVSLLRPGATTHAFNQDQNYVPLSFTKATSGPSRLFVTAPANLNQAPAGDHLVFLVDSIGALLSQRVPSVGRWLRMASTAGADACDQNPPGAVTNFTPDVVGENEVWFTWTGPGDDDYLVASGIPTAFDLVGSTDETAPGPAGSPGSGSVRGLYPCTWYNFTVTAWDDNQQQSAPVSVGVQTTCGGLGGGFSAREAEGGEGAAIATATGASLAGEESLVPGTGLLIAETRTTAEGDWRVTVRMAGEAEEIDPGDGETVFVQQRDATGAWRTLARHRVGASAGPLGIASLRDQGRLVFPANYQLDHIGTGIRSGAQRYALVSANHSRLGDMGTTGGRVALDNGDLLSLTFQATGDSALGGKSWYLTVRRVEGAEPSPKFLRRGPGAEIPLRFALHANQPNPFRGTTVVPFDLPWESEVRLEVFDLLGRRVATIADATYPAGAHAVEWNLRDAGGGTVRPGVYVYRMSAGQFRAKGKMSVLP